MSVKIRSNSFSHNCRRKESMFGTFFVISWKIDVAGNKIRSERIIKKEVDEKAARKFCEKWNIEFPDKVERPVSKFKNGIEW